MYSQLYDTRVVAGKKVYVVDKHHFALQAWAEENFRNQHVPFLLSIDHHTDSHCPFQHKIGSQFLGVPKDFRARSLALLATVDPRDKGSLFKAIAELRFDEQIATALHFGIFEAAFVISFDGRQTPSLDDHVEAWEGQDCLWNKRYIPKGIYVTEMRCHPSCQRMPHNDDCTRDFHASVIEDKQLVLQLDQINKFGQKKVGFQKVLDTKFVLDIDLDFFHSRKAIQPDSPGIFHQLISHAKYLTVAREAGCVADLADEGEDLDSEWLLKCLIEHIEAAQS